MNILVIGKLVDTAPYVGRPGFDVMPPRTDWTPELNRQFILAALRQGQPIMFVSWQVTGQYRNELIQILQELIA